MFGDVFCCISTSLRVFCNSFKGHDLDLDQHVLQAERSHGAAADGRISHHGPVHDGRDLSQKGAMASGLGNGAARNTFFFGLEIDGFSSEVFFLFSGQLEYRLPEGASPRECTRSFVGLLINCQGLEAEPCSPQQTLVRGRGDCSVKELGPSSLGIATSNCRSHGNNMSSL